MPGSVSLRAGAVRSAAGLSSAGAFSGTVGASSSAAAPSAGVPSLLFTSALAFASRCFSMSVNIFAFAASSDFLARAFFSAIRCRRRESDWLDM